MCRCYYSIICTDITFQYMKVLDSFENYKKKMKISVTVPTKIGSQQYPEK